MAFSVSGTPGVAVIGNSYTFTPTIDGGTAPYAVTADPALPTGYTLDATTGAITSTSVPNSSVATTLTFTDSASTSESTTLQVSITPVTKISLGVANISTYSGKNLDYLPQVTNGSGTVTYAVASGTLPPGISLNANTGNISGTTTSAGSYTFNLTATDDTGTATAKYEIIIYDEPALTNTPPAGEIGKAYSWTLELSGGSDTSQLTVTTSDTLPGGLTLSGTTLSGTPTTAANTKITLTVSDGTESATYPVTLDINEALSVTSTVPAYIQTNTETTFTPTIIGGVSPISVTADPALPTGYTLNTSTGTISSTTSPTGSISTTLTFTDSVGATATLPISFISKNPLEISGTFPTIVVGDSVSFSPVVTNPIGTLTFSTNTDLPEGLTLDTSTGNITGIVSSLVASSTVTLTVTSATTSETANVKLTLTIVNPISISSSEQTGYATQPFTFTPAVTGGYGTRSFSVTKGSLPSGISIDPTSGSLSGTPAASATSTFTITVTDSSGSASADYTLKIFALPTISNTSTQSAEVSAPFNWVPKTTGGNGSSLKVTYDTSTLPSGVTPASDGSLSGTPTAAGNVVVSATVTDGTQTTDVSILFSISPKLEAPATLSLLTTTGTPTTSALTTTSSTGVGKTTWTQGTDADTTEFSLNGNVISLAAKTKGTYTGTYTGTDTLGVSVSTVVTAVVVDPINIVYTSQQYEVGVAFSLAPTTSGGSGSYVYTIPSGYTLPTGVTLDQSTGILSGTFTKDGTYSFNVVATDNLYPTISETIPVSISTVATLSIDGSFPPLVNIGETLNFTPTVTGGLSSKVYSISGDALPAGLSFDDSTGAITGIPTTVGTSNVVITVNDGKISKSLNVYITITKKLSVTVSSKNMEVGIPGQILFTIADGAGTKTTTITEGTLPAGLTLGSQGSGSPIISGTPTTDGLVSITVTTSDETGSVDTAVVFTIYKALSITPPPGYLYLSSGKALNFTPDVTGGTPDAVWALSQGALPANTSLNSSTGTVSGSPARGSYNFTLKCTDAFTSAAQPYTLIVNDPISISYAPITTVANKLVSVTPTVTGDVTGTITYSSTSLPSGLSIDPSTGVISGTPSIPVTTNVEVTAQDQLSSSTTTLAISIEQAMTITGAFSEIVVGKAFSFTPTIAGGNQNTLSFTLNGTLPTGLSFDAKTGSVSGTATDTVGNGNVIIISVSDGTQAASYTATLAVFTSITVANGTVSGEVGAALSYTPSTQGGHGTRTFAQLTGQLPPGLSIDADTGVVSGTPVSSETNLLTTFIAQDDTGSSIYTITFTITPKLGISGVANRAIVGAAYSYIPTITGGTGETYFSILAGSLPPGLTLSSSTGQISGTPTTSGSYAFILAVTDGTISTNQTISLVVTPSTSASGSAADATTATVLQYCSEYISAAAVVPATEYSSETALRIYGDIVLAIMNSPSTGAMDALWNMMSLYKTTYFMEYNFFRGLAALDAKTFLYVQAVYTAYRNATMTPTSNFSYSYLLDATRCQPLVTYLQNKISSSGS